MTRKKARRAAVVEKIEPTRDDEQLLLDVARDDVHPWQARPLAALRGAVEAERAAEAAVGQAVLSARQAQVTWDVIGFALGCSGEWARRRYGKWSTRT